MTREEAKRRLLNIERSLPNTFRTKEDVRNFEALEMAIKALEQEPMRDFTEEEAEAYSKALDKIYKPIGINVFDEPSGDLISRQAVQDYIAKYLSQYLYDNVREAIEAIDEFIGELPPVNPQEPKTGHWIIKDGKEQGYDIGGVKTWYIQIMCDKCGFIKNAIEGHTGQYQYCPNCGAKMESEDKE